MCSELSLTRILQIFELFLLHPIELSYNLNQGSKIHFLQTLTIILINH